MPRVLIAASHDWVGTARLPSTLTRAGIEVDLLDGGDTLASYSSAIRQHHIVREGAADIAKAALELAGAYDRVILCDERVLMAVARSGDPRARDLLPARADLVAGLMDKTVFPGLAEAADLRVPDWRVSHTISEARGYAEDLGGKLVLKGRHGQAGDAVRVVEGATQAAEVACELGTPVLVEHYIDGLLGMMPCLYERGALCAAFSATKERTFGPLGFSTVNRLMPLDRRLLKIARKAGEAFEFHGFVSFDWISTGAETEPVVLEINLRPVPQLHAGRHADADMATALAQLLEGRPVVERVSSRSRLAVLFPQELQRMRTRHGSVPGILKWATTPGALADVPWSDPGLLGRYVRGQRPSQPPR